MSYWKDGFSYERFFSVSAERGLFPHATASSLILTMIPRDTVAGEPKPRTYENFHLGRVVKPSLLQNVSTPNIDV